MAKKDKKDIKQVIADALEHYHKMKPSIKDSTKRQNESLLSEFYRFVDTLPARDRTMKIFSQKGLNRYKEYLIDKMERSKTDGQKRNFGVGQLNRCGSMIARLINNVLKPEEVVPNHVDWMKVEDTRREDQKGHFPLLENEVTAIENCSGLTPAEEEYRDIFLLQIECGQRVSDLAKILTGKYRVKQGKKFKYIIISTIKENIKAHIPLRPKMRMWMEKVNSHKLITPVKFEKIVNGKGNGIYNQAIRRIVKKAGLDREIVRINSLLLEVRGPLYEEITNHAARCTFITNMLKKGVSPKQVSKMTGHASEEMINRVYAQLEEDDEINLIESDLYNDMDDDNANSPTDTSSKKPNEQATDAQIVPNKTEKLNIPITKDGDFLQKNDVEEYFKGLSDVVDKAQKEYKSPIILQDKEFFDKVVFKWPKSFVGRLSDEQLYSTDFVFDLWQKLDAYLRDSPSSEAYDFLYNFFRINLLHYLIDHSIEKRLGNELVEKLERILHEICEEHLVENMIYYSYRYPEINSAIDDVGLVIIRAIHYVLHNRPGADEYFMKCFLEEDIKLEGLPDWNLVLKGLQTIPDTRLQAIIERTKIPTANKIKLYNSIVSDNLNRFADVIELYDEEVNILTCYAYFIACFDTMMEYCNKIDNLRDDDILELTTTEFLIQKMLMSIPFINSRPNTEELLDYGTFKLNELDGLLNFFIILKKHSYSPEIRVFNTVINQINHFPELKEAYDEYKAKQKAVSNQTDVEAIIASEEDQGENRMNDAIRVNYLIIDVQNIDIDKLIRLLTEKDELNKFQPFITVLESTDNVNVATCLKHFLDTPSNTPLSFRLKWNGHTKASLKFLIRLLKNTKKEASRLNVIDVSNREGISPKFVSKWTGSGELWTPVCEVFGGSPDYMMSVGLGKEGSRVREINLEQYNTIADIYFECKK